VQTQPVGEGEARLLGRWDHEGVSDLDVSSSGEWLAFARGRQIFLLPTERLDASPHRVGEHTVDVGQVAFTPGDRRLVSSDVSGEVRIWSVDGEASTLERTTHSGLKSPRALMDRPGSTLVAGQGGSHESPDVALVWDLDGPPDADPLTLRNGDATWLNDLSLDPSGHWLATAHDHMALLWPLGAPNAWILRGQAPPFIEVAFTPDGRWLASDSQEGVLRLWPLSPAVASRSRVLIREGATRPMMAMGSAGQNILVTSWKPGRAVLVPVDGGAPRSLERFSSAWLESPAISPDGRLAAAGSRMRPEGNLIELWELRSGNVRTLDPRSDEEECGWDPNVESAVFDVEFTSEGRLLSAGLSGLRLWNLDDETNTLLRPCAEGMLPYLGGSRADRYLLVEADFTRKTSLLSFHDLSAGISRELTSHGTGVASVALDPKGEIAVTGGFDGVVRVGKVNDERPHLLYGHDLEVTSVAVSPDGQWIASGSQDGTIRLWPMPEGPPFHTLPHGEILDRLRSFTNLRVVRDDGTETGYGVRAGPFPGWAVRPDW
jgi:WD40 repeat protein